MVHFAPPCSTFSVVRNRSSLTRSADKPDGFWPTEHRCRDGNTIAFNTLWAARYVAEVLGQGVSIENPHTSYMWPFLQPWCSEGHNDVVFHHACLVESSENQQCYDVGTGRLNLLLPYAQKEVNGSPVDDMPVNLILLLNGAKTQLSWLQYTSLKYALFGQTRYTPS